MKDSLDKPSSVPLRREVTVIYLGPSLLKAAVGLTRWTTLTDKKQALSPSLAGKSSTQFGLSSRRDCRVSPSFQVYLK